MVGILPSGTDNGLEADVALGAANRLQHPVTRRPATIEAGTERGEDFDHVAD
jgi:hypothetical protein